METAVAPRIARRLRKTEYAQKKITHQKFAAREKAPL